jgi:hypothetical protein
MPKIIATVSTVDERPVEVSARRGEVQLLFLAEGGVDTASLVDRLRFSAERCLLLESALKTARLVMLSEEEPD